MSKKESFESALERIEAIVDAMEDGELALDDMLKKYEEASKLISQCLKQLSDAEGKLEKLSANGDDFKLEPM